MQTKLVKEQGRGYSSSDPMDLIRFEMLEHLSSWVHQLQTHPYSGHSWQEFGWHIYQLRERFTEWAFFEHGRWIVEAVHLHDRGQVARIGEYLQLAFGRELAALKERSQRA